MRPLALCACLAGCNLPVYDLSSATADASNASTSSTSTTGTSDPTDATSTGDSPTNFIEPRDLPDHPPGWCDFWDDDCPSGQKCVPVSLDGDNFPETAQCVPIAPMPDGLNEKCMLLGTGRDGLDTCDRGMACRFPDWETLTGTCLGLCTGSPQGPTCADPDALCHITESDFDPICLLPCDPLEQDCASGGACLPVKINLFACVNEGSGDDGQVFDACEYLNACDPGLLCANKSLATECDPNASGCCLPFCDTSKPNTCPGAGQECLSWYEEGQAPPNYQHVGLCGLP